MRRAASTDSTQQEGQEQPGEAAQPKSRWPRWIAILVAQFVVLWNIFHFFYHIETTPMTNRWRYVAITNDEWIALADFQIHNVRT